MPAVTTLFIPSPADGVWYVGPLPLRGYALCIIAGIIAAIWIGERRWVGRGGRRGEVTDLALWAVPFGVIGGRLYHVITDHDLYFGAGRTPIDALYVWRGGLGIWGAIALGGVGVWIGARSKGIRVPPVLDAMAPGVLVAQAMGRWGNWFNQELFGRPSTQPWALKIDPANRPPGYEQYATFQPTFLYECIWDLGAFGFVLWADRRWKLGHGRVLALYVMAYTAGRGWIETLRIDNVEYQHVLGLRLNVWTSIVLFVLAAVYFVVVGRKRPGRETVVYTESRLAADLAAAESESRDTERRAHARRGDPFGRGRERETAEEPARSRPLTGISSAVSATPGHAMPVDRALPVGEPALSVAVDLPVGRACRDHGQRPQAPVPGSRPAPATSPRDRGARSLWPSPRARMPLAAGELSHLPHPPHRRRTPVAS